MYVNVENLVLEMDEFGDLFVINLLLFLFFIICYCFGDSVILSDLNCVCGCKYMMINDIVGRRGVIVFGNIGFFLVLIFYYVFKNFVL